MTDSFAIERQRHAVETAVDTLSTWAAMPAFELRHRIEAERDATLRPLARVMHFVQGTAELVARVRKRTGAATVPDAVKDHPCDRLHRIGPALRAVHEVATWSDGTLRERQWVVAQQLPEHLGSIDALMGALWDECDAALAVLERVCGVADVTLNPPLEA